MLPATPSNFKLVLAIVLPLALVIVLSSVVVLIMYRKYYFKSRMSEDIELKQKSFENQGLDRVNVNNG